MSSVQGERKLSLPTGDPESGYASHDRSPVFGTGTVPDDEQEIYDARTQADEDERKAVEDSEHEIATQRASEAEAEEAAVEAKMATKSTKASTSSTSSSGSSSGS